MLRRHGTGRLEQKFDLRSIADDVTRDNAGPGRRAFQREGHEPNPVHNKAEALRLQTLPVDVGPEPQNEGMRARRRHGQLQHALRTDGPCLTRLWLGPAEGAKGSGIPVTAEGDFQLSCRLGYMVFTETCNHDRIGGKCRPWNPHAATWFE